MCKSVACFIGFTTYCKTDEAFEDPLPMPANAAAFPFEGAFVKGIDSLSWMANNTKKLLNSQSSGPHCWTFFSTSTFGKRNKVPQENIPNATAEKVKEAMLAGVEDAGAALPTNTPGIPCIFDPHGRTGICGDWLLGSSLEAAALSGTALANQARPSIADYFESGGTRPDEFAVGLQNEFQPLKGHEIGQFPGVEFKEEEKLYKRIVATLVAEEVAKLSSSKSPGGLYRVMGVVVKKHHELGKRNGRFIVQWKRRETVDDAMATGDGDLAINIVQIYTNFEILAVH
ncbi:hypothetical protein RJ640_000072 [Escallonia rubra]|uniref:Uncharacterized protein n=1 Tax=Escallonia rubra TaxID=112253 RepID=A0AA88U1W5_9ASTE|nr:hypothetical protein RJ640_000072 [Escallonia rubra]